MAIIVGRLLDFNNDEHRLMHFNNLFDCNVEQ